MTLAGDLFKNMRGEHAATAELRARLHQRHDRGFALAINFGRVRQVNHQTATLECVAGCIPTRAQLSHPGIDESSFDNESPLSVVIDSGNLEHIASLP